MDDGIYRRRPGDYRRPLAVFDVSQECSSVVHGEPSFAKGVTHYQDQLPPLEDRTRVVVEFVPEPRNPYDGLAVALDVAGRRCGYVAARYAARLHDVVRGLNRAGFAVVTRGLVRRETWETYHGTRDSGVVLDVWLPDWHDLTVLADLVGLRAAHNRVLTYLSDSDRRDVVDFCWDGYPESLTRVLLEHAHRAPELTWRSSGPVSYRTPEWHASFARDDLRAARERAALERKLRQLLLRRARQLTDQAKAVEREHKRARAAAARATAEEQAVELLRAGRLTRAEVAEQVRLTRAAVARLASALADSGAPVVVVNRYNDVQVAQRVTRALKAVRLQRAGLSRAQIGDQLGCGLDIVGALLADGKFYDDPATDAARVDTARAAATRMRDGTPKGSIADALGVSARAAKRACRDAAALAHLGLLG